MASFRITLVDQTTELVPGADAYQQEGPLTTFFALAPGRSTIDSWSTRLASFRTADISAIRRELVGVVGEGADADDEPAPLLRSA